MVIRGTIIESCLRRAGSEVPISAMVGSTCESRRPITSCPMYQIAVVSVSSSRTAALNNDLGQLGSRC